MLDAHVKMRGDRAGGSTTSGRRSPLWRAKDDLLRSVAGVGPVLSTTLLAEVPELGTLGQKQLVALIGVAPLNRDSGQWRGRHSVWGGRARVRAVLYMAATAIRHNPACKALDERLTQAGKAHQAAIIACMHKLLRICNAILRRSACAARSLPEAFPPKGPSADPDDSLCDNVPVTNVESAAQHVPRGSHGSERSERRREAEPDPCEPRQAKCSPGAGSACAICGARS